MQSGKRGWGGVPQECRRGFRAAWAAAFHFQAPRRKGGWSMAGLLSSREESARPLFTEQEPQIFRE